MNANVVPRTIAMIVAMGLGKAADARLPGTLNFRNITATHINQTVPESSANEKEVDFGDFDNDGDLDVVVAAALSGFGQRRNKLYRNDNGIFNEISGAPVIPGFSSTDVSRSASLRDFDLDGWLDILIVNDGSSTGPPGRIKLYMSKPVDGALW